MARNTTVKADHNAPGITEMLAKFIVEHPSRGWDDQVEREAHRTFANWLGCAIGPSQHETVQAAVAAIAEFEPAPQASLIGRKEKVDMANAALINGISSHTFDFDDTHLKTIIHPAGPVASAILALAERIGSSGREMLDALVIGIEVSCRVGNAVYPNHYDRGWHITGSTGMLGSAAACARLLKLDAARTQMALGIAASQPVGLREQFGTMTKPFHPGAAAKAGMTAALMAKHGFTASKRALEAPRGLLQVFSDKTDWSEVTENLGKTWEIALNTYKPFACGIVIHPSIDGCVQLRDKYDLKPADIAKVTIKVHSLVLELTGKKTPADGLQGKFSVYHSCAAGIIFGRAGEHEYADEIVTRDDVVALRSRVEAVVDDSIDEASADVTIDTVDGRKLHVFVEHAIGSVEHPMSDEQLKAKFVDQSTPIIGAAKSEQAWSLAMRLASLPNATELVAAATA
ncbi:2-methylcitrate dehydratase PrpD [Noviherbaspirillum humi]|uniref:2-methylcitrate dehydratase PrpD n=1 Tax=Noviherbaspirillum humi TaxID=1688639 RepID=A0A239LP35_9BURK|nr:MmgE/PrpD family protein [Noviherbaspirillum humi]SNT32306.1 2-methylcitrate dehydratase PrpD [Noviherbaspirillum humi]